MSAPAISPPATGTLRALLEAGYAALETEDLERAELQFRRAVQLDPRSAAAWRALAETQVGARHGMCLRWAEAADAYHAAAAAAAARRQSRARQRRLRYRALAQSGAALAAAALILAVGSDIAYRDRYLPGVSVGSVAVGNLRHADGARLIAARQQALAQQVVTLQAGEHTLRVPLTATRAERSTQQLDAAFRYGHEPSFAQRTLVRLRALGGRRLQIDDTRAMPAAIDGIVAQFAAQVDQPQRDAQLLHTTTGWAVTAEQTGVALVREAAAATLAQQADTADSAPLETRLTLPVSQTPPTRTAADLEPLQLRLSALASAPLTVRSGEHTWTLDRSLLIDPAQAGAGAMLAPSADLIARQLDQIAGEVAVAAQPSKLERNGERITAIVAGQPGQELDRAAAAEVLRAAITGDAQTVDLPTVAVAPPAGEVEQMGLIAELGRGNSQFLTYSSPERDANVETGGRDISGVLVKPGDTFSFTQTVGEITWEKGYRWGEAIESGIVVPSLGGGICQVSTTLFRAAFWSGLDIVERHHHSFRLPWYEVDAPPGMDATIALGGPDLKIRNNTSHWILIMAETDLATKRQTVIIYGTPDGRQVQMQPIAGGNIGVERYVIAGNGAVNDDTYMSYYTQ